MGKQRKSTEEPVDPFASNNMVMDKGTSGGQNPAYLLPQMDESASVSNFDTSKYEGYIDGMQSGSLFNDKARAENQGFFEQGGAALVRAGAEVLGGTISGVGSIGGFFTDVLTEGGRQEADFSNAVMEFGEGIMKTAAANNPIYRENPGKAFDVGDAAWWWEGVPSTASSLSMLIPARGVAGGLSMFGKMLNLSGKVGKTAKFLGEVGTMAVVSRNAENMRESMSVAEQTAQKVKEQFGTLGEEELANTIYNTELGKKFLETGKEPTLENYSKFAGAQAGMMSYKVNASNIAFDFLQTAIAYKALSGLTRNKNITNLWLGESSAKIAAAEANALGKSFGFLDRAKVGVKGGIVGALGGASEGVEEIINTIGTNEGLRIGDKAAGIDNSDASIKNRLSKYLDDSHTWEAGFWGFVGGKLYETASRQFEKIVNPGRAQDMKGNNALNEIGSRAQNISRVTKDLQDLETLKKNGGISETEYNEVLHKIGNQAAFDMGINAASSGQVDNLLHSISDPKFREILTNNMSPEEKATMTDEKYASILSNMSNSILEAEEVYQGVTNKLSTRELDVPLHNYILNKGLSTGYDIIQREKENAQIQEEYDKEAGSSRFFASDNIDFHDTIELEALKELEKTYNSVLDKNKDKENYTNFLEKRLAEIKERKEVLKTISGKIELNDDHAKLVGLKYKQLGNEFQIATNKDVNESLFSKKKEQEVKTEFETKIKEARKVKEEYYNDILRQSEIAAVMPEGITKEELEQFGNDEVLVRYNKLEKRLAELKTQEEELNKPSSESVDTIEEPVEVAPRNLNEQDNGNVTTAPIPNDSIQEGNIESELNVITKEQKARLQTKVAEAIESGSIEDIKRYRDIAINLGIKSDGLFIASLDAAIDKLNVQEPVDTSLPVNESYVDQLDTLLSEEVPQTIGEAFRQEAILAEDVNPITDYTSVNEIAVIDEPNILFTGKEIEEVTIKEPIVIEEPLTENLQADTNLQNIVTFIPGLHNIDQNNTKRNGFNYNVTKDVATSIENIKDLKVGEVLEYKIDAENLYHKDTKEDSAIGLVKDGKIVAYINTESQVEKQYLGALNSKNQADILKYATILAELKELRNKIWKNKDKTFTTKVEKITSGTIIPGERSNPLDVIAGSYKLAFVDPNAPSVTQLKVVGENDVYYGTKKSTIYNADAQYQPGVEYLLLEGYNFDGSLQTRTPIRINRSNLDQKAALNVYDNISEIVNAINAGAKLNSEQIEDLKDKINDITPTNKYNQEKSEVNGQVFYTIPKPYFKIHSRRIEFLFDNNTKLGTIWFKDKNSGQIKFVIEEWKSKNAVFANEADYMSAKGKVLSSIDVRDSNFQNSIVDSLQKRPFNLVYSKLDTDTSLADKMMKEGRFYADFGVLKDGNSKLSNFWGKPNAVVIDGLTRHQTGNLVVEVSGKVEEKQVEDTSVPKTKEVVNFIEKYEADRFGKMYAGEEVIYLDALKSVSNLEELRNMIEARLAILEPKFKSLKGQVKERALFNIGSYKTQLDYLKNIKEFEKLDSEITIKVKPIKVKAEAKPAELYDDTEGIVVDDGLTMLFTNEEITENTTPEQKQQNWERMFGKNVPFDGNLDNLIRVKGELAYAVFTTAGAKLYRNAPMGAEYHEAFHAVTQEYLTASELDQLYAEAADAFDGTTNTNKVIEEKLAEEFRLYALNQKLVKDSPIKAWFKKIWNAIKTAIGVVNKDTIFYNIYSGKFNYQPTERVREFIKENPLTMLSEDLDGKFTQQDIKQIVEWGTMIVANDLPEVSGKSNKEILENPNQYNLRLRVKTRLKFASQRAETNNDPETKVGIDKIAENWGDLNSGFWNLIVSNVKRKLNYNIAFDDTQPNSFEGNVQMQKDWDDRVAYSKSGKESFDFDLKRLIMLTPQLDNADVDVLADGSLVFKNISKPNSAKLPQPIDFNLVYPMLVQNMSNANSSEEMMARLKELTIINPSMYYLWNKISSDEILKQKWFTNFRKNYIEESHIRFSDLENEGFQITMDNSNKTYTIADTWVNQIQVYSSLIDKENETYNNKSVDEIVQLQDQITSYLQGKELDNAINAVVELANTIGININSNVVTKLINNKQLQEHYNMTDLQLLNDKIFNNVNWIATKLVDSFKSGQPFIFAERGRVKNIADLVAYYSPDVVENSYLNTQGKVVYSMSKPSHLSEFFSMIQEINNPFTVNKTEAKQRFVNKIKDILSDKSMMFSNWIFNENKNNGWLNLKLNEKSIDQIGIEDLNMKALQNFSFYKAGDVKQMISGYGASYTDLSNNDWLLHNAINFGVVAGKDKDWANYPIIIPSDSGNIYAIKAKRYTVLLDNGNLKKNTVAYKALHNIIQQEMTRMKVASNLLFERKMDNSVNRYEVKPKKLNKEVQNNLIIGYHYKNVAANDVVVDGEVWFKKGEPVTLEMKNGIPTPTGKVFTFAMMDYGSNSLNNIKELKLENVFTRDKLNAKTNDLIEEYILGFTKNLIESEVARHTPYKEVISQSKVKTKDFLEYWSNDFNLFIAEYAINNYIFGVEQANIFNGTIAEYKNEKDTAKRAKQVSTTKQTTSTHHRGEAYEAIIMKDILLDATDMAKIELNLRRTVKDDKMVEKAIGKFKKINVADAQGYITLDRMEAMLKDYGRWNPQYEKVFKVARNPNLDLTDADLGLLLEVVKPFYYGRDYNSVTGVLQSVQVKTALLPLIPKLVKGTDLEKLVSYLEKNNIGEVYFESAVKVGRMRLSDIMNGNSLKPDFESYVVPHTFKNANWGLQLDVPSHLKDEQNKLGVQIAKLTFANLSANQVYELNGKKFSGKELQMTFQKLVALNIEESSKELMEELKIEKDKDGTAVLKDLEVISELLKSEVKSRGLSNNFLKALNMKDGKFVLPLSATNLRSKFMSILSSLFTGRVTNQRFPGGHVVVASPAMLGYDTKDGVNTEGIEFIDSVKDRVKDGKFQLKYLDVDGGKVTKVEALLPSWSTEFFKKGQRVNINELSEELRTMIGYRIPTEGKYSTFVFEIVGFLPESSGSTIILPYELIAQTGWDFDVDSLYMMQKSFKTLVNGKEAASYIAENNNIEIKQASKYINELKKPTGLLEVPKEVRASYENFLETATEYRVIPSNDETTDSRNNKIFDIFESILSNSVSYAELVSGGNFNDLIDLKNEVEQLLGLDKAGENIYTRKGQDDFRNTFMAGRALKGMAANGNSALAVLQNVGAKFKDGLTFNFKYPSSNVVQGDLSSLAREYTPEKITTLKPNEIFVFGSNPLGVNGNPDKWPNMSASMATKNGWVQQGEVINNKLSSSGKAFGVVTVSAPGAKKSKTPSEIKAGIELMLESARKNSNKKYLVTKFGTENAGWDISTIKGLFQELSNQIPNNVILPREFEVRDNKQANVVQHNIIANNAEGTFKNVNGDVITDHNAQSLAMSLDIVKEGFPYNLNTYTFNTATAMVATGIPWRETGLYITQPALKRIAEKVMNNESVLDDIEEREVQIVKKEYQAALYQAMYQNGDITKEQAIEDRMWDKKNDKLVPYSKMKVFMSKKGIERMDINLDIERAYSADELRDMIKMDNPNYRKVQPKEARIAYYKEQLNIINQWGNKYLLMGDEFSHVVNNLTADKLGAGPDLMITPDFLNNIRRQGVTDLYFKDQLPVIQSMDNMFVLDKVYNDDAYPVFKAYLANSNVIAFDALAPLFLETQDGYIDLKNQIYQNLKLKKSDEVNKKLDKFLFKALYNRYGSQKFTEDDVKRLMGLNKKAVKFDNVDLDTYQTYSAAEKLLYVKKNLLNNDNSFNILNRLTPKLEDMLVEKRKIHSIQFDKPKSSDNIDNYVIESFGELLASDNEYIKLLAEDLIQYDFFINGLTYGVNSWREFIPMEKQIEMGIGTDMYNIISHINSNAIFGNFEDLFMRNNWNNVNIVPIARTKYQYDDKGERIKEFDNEIGDMDDVMDSKFFNWNSKINLQQPFAVEKTKLKLEKQNIKNSRYLLIRNNDTNTLLKRHLFGDERDNINNEFPVVWYYPVSKLGSAYLGNEVTTNSVLDFNNIEVNEEQMIQMLESNDNFQLAVGEYNAKLNSEKVC